jgi:hypothetical protein
VNIVKKKDPFKEESWLNILLQVRTLKQAIAFMKAVAKVLS